MRVLHFTSQFLPWARGGTEIFGLQLCQQLQQLNTACLVAFHSSGREAVGSYTYEDVAVQVLPALSDSKERITQYRRATQSAGKFRQLLDEYQPDLIHFHNFSANQGITHLREAKQAGAKLVLTYHSPTVSCSQHGLLYRSQTPCDGRIALQRCSECRLVGAGLPPVLAHLAATFSLPGLNATSQNALIRLLTTRSMTAFYRDSWQEMLELVDALHILANWVAEIAMINGAPSHKVHLIRTGGPKPVTPKGDRPGTQGLRIACIGRSTRIKGMHVLVEAMQQLPPELPVKVTLFRADEEWEEKSYGQALQQRIEADDRIEVRYRLPHNQLLQELTEFDICVVPSLWLETGPLVVLEAFAAGVPVLGSRLGGIAELVGDGVNGLLFEPGNADALAGILHQLILYPEQLQVLRKNVQPPRTMRQVATEILNLYRILIASQ